MNRLVPYISTGTEGSRDGKSFRKYMICCEDKRHRAVSKPDLDERSGM